MLTKLQTYKENNEEGFTLIELLVVILIIGILSAIAIPAFLNQRKSAVDSTLQSDLASTAKGVEDWIVKQGSTAKPLTLAQVQNVNGATELLPASGLQGALSELKVSSGAVITASGTSAGYCLEGFNAGGDTGSTDNGGYVYASLSGGLQDTTGTCVAGVFTAGTSSAPVEVPAGEGKTWNRTAAIVDRDSWEEFASFPYTVNMVANGGDSYTYNFVFNNSEVTGTIPVGLCYSDYSDCRDFNISLSGGVGSVTTTDGFDEYGGFMDQLMLSGNRMVLIS